LERVAGGFDFGYKAGIALLPLLQLGLGEGVRQREHGDEVAVLAERAGGLAADAQGRGVGSLELGVFGLEVLELAEQLVVLRVRQLRLGEDVVGVVRAFQNPPQLSGACRSPPAHLPLASSWITAIATPTSRSISSALALGRRPSPHAPSRWPKVSSRRRRKASSATRSSSMRLSCSLVSWVRCARRS